MLKIIIALLMTFTLSSCRTTYEQKLVCSQIAKHQIPPTPLCDISFKFDRCRCRCFNYNSWSVAPLTKCERFRDLSGAMSLVDGEEVLDFELEYCDGIGGSFAQDQVNNIRSNVKALNLIKENLCQK